MKRPLILALLFSLAASGCGVGTVRSGLPPGNAARGYMGRWHPAFLFGMIPGTVPYDLSRICPGGWAEVTVSRDPSTLLAGLLTLFIYSPSRVTVVCSINGATGIPPYAGYAPTSGDAPGPHMPLPPEDD